MPFQFGERNEKMTEKLKYLQTIRTKVNFQNKK